MLCVSYSADSTGPEEAGPALSWWGHLPTGRGLWAAGVRGFGSKIGQVKDAAQPIYFSLTLPQDINKYLFLPRVGLK